MPTRHDHVRLSGAQHILATIKATGRSMVLVGLLTGIIAALLVELYGAYATGSFTTTSTHVFAAAFAVVCAYGAAVTVLVRGMIATLVESIEWVADEVQQLAGNVVREAETVLHVADGHSTEHDMAPEPVESGIA